MADHANTGIYEIVNKIDGKRYVGSAVKFAQRWHAHRSKLRSGTHGNYLLQGAWSKCGEDSFDFRVVEICAKSDLLVREQFHIDSGCDYNIAMTAGSPLGVKHTQETRERMSSSRKGLVKSSEWIKAAAEGVAKSWEDSEVRSRRSDAIRESWARRKANGCIPFDLTAEQTRLRNERSHSRANVAARVKRMTGSTLSAAHRAAISAGNRGRQVTPETREKISRTLRSRAASSAS